MIAELEFHHFGLATRDSDASASTLRALGYTVPEPIFDPLQNVNLMLCVHPAMPAIELVSPAETPGPLDPWLADHAELIYHVCYAAPDLEEAVQALQDSGIRLITVAEPKPAVLFGGARVAFYMARGIGLIEILEQS